MTGTVTSQVTTQYAAVTSGAACIIDARTYRKGMLSSVGCISASSTSFCDDAATTLATRRYVSILPGLLIIIISPQRRRLSCAQQGCRKGDWRMPQLLWVQPHDGLQPICMRHKTWTQKHLHERYDCTNECRNNRTELQQEEASTQAGRNNQQQARKLIEHVQVLCLKIPRSEEEKRKVCLSQIGSRSS